jgi:hypothetical protein
MAGTDQLAPRASDSIAPPWLRVPLVNWGDRGAVCPNPRSPWSRPSHKAGPPILVHQSPAPQVPDSSLYVGRWTRPSPPTLRLCNTSLHFDFLLCIWLVPSNSGAHTGLECALFTMVPWKWNHETVRVICNIEKPKKVCNIPNYNKMVMSPKAPKVCNFKYYKCKNKA